MTALRAVRLRDADRSQQRDDALCSAPTVGGRTSHRRPQLRLRNQPRPRPSSRCAHTGAVTRPLVLPVRVPATQPSSYRSPYYHQDRPLMAHQLSPCRQTPANCTTRREKPPTAPCRSHCVRRFRRPTRCRLCERERRRDVHERCDSCEDRYKTRAGALSTSRLWMGTSGALNSARAQKRQRPPNGGL